MVSLMLTKTYPNPKNWITTQKHTTMRNTDINNNDEKQAFCDSLVNEVKERVQKLKEYGMNEQEITSLIHTNQPVLTLTISKNYRIFLGDNHIEVHMDYRGELTKIYSEVRPWGLSERALQSIEDVTNPLLNSINEKCARIRKAFVNAMDSEAAKPYIIKGVRGGIKKIDLPKEYINWELA